MKVGEIQNLIEEILDKVSMTAKKISIENSPASSSKDTAALSSKEPSGGNDSFTIWFSVEVDEPRYFFNRGGEGLFALNHLVKRIIETRKEGGSAFNVMIDINGYHKKRIEELREMARMMAERARYFKSSIEVDPMSAFERRIIHESLSDAPDLKTESEGEGRFRRVVIKYVGEM